MQLASIAKAIVGAVVAALSVIATALDAGTLTAQDCVYAAIAALTALGAVWIVPNKIPPEG